MFHHGSRTDSASSSQVFGHANVEDAEPQVAVLVLCIVEGSLAATRWLVKGSLQTIAGSLQDASRRKSPCPETTSRGSCPSLRFGQYRLWAFCDSFDLRSDCLCLQTGSMVQSNFYWRKDEKRGNEVNTRSSGRRCDAKNTPPHSYGCVLWQHHQAKPLSDLQGTETFPGKATAAAKS